MMERGNLLYESGWKSAVRSGRIDFGDTEME